MATLGKEPITLAIETAPRVNLETQSIIYVRHNVLQLIISLAIPIRASAPSLVPLQDKPISMPTLRIGNASSTVLLTNMLILEQSYVCLCLDVSLVLSQTLITDSVCRSAIIKLTLIKKLALPFVL